MAIYFQYFEWQGLPFSGSQQKPLAVVVQVGGGTKGGAAAQLVAKNS